MSNSSRSGGASFIECRSLFCKSFNTTNSTSTNFNCSDYQGSVFDCDEFSPPGSDGRDGLFSQTELIVSLAIGLALFLLIVGAIVLYFVLGRCRKRTNALAKYYDKHYAKHSSTEDVMLSHVSTPNMHKDISDGDILSLDNDNFLHSIENLTVNAFIQKQERLNQRNNQTAPAPGTIYRSGAGIKVDPSDVITPAEKADRLPDTLSPPSSN